MKNLKKLSRESLKNISGGFGEDFESIAPEGKSYMCCNNGGCSICVSNALPACIAGAWPVPC